MWNEKRREFALKLREQRAEYVASRTTFQHERAEKVRRAREAEPPPPDRAERPRPAPRVSAPPGSRTFVGMCNQRDTAPVAAVLPWNEGAQRPQMPPPAGGGHAAQPPGYRRAQDSGYGETIVGNAKWFAEGREEALNVNSAPRGFPLRKGGGFAPPVSESARGGGRRFADKATAASMQENGRAQLDRLLMERVAKIADAASPAPPQAVPPKAAKAKKAATKKRAA